MHVSEVRGPDSCMCVRMYVDIWLLPNIVDVFNVFRTSIMCCFNYTGGIPESRLTKT